MAEENGHSLVVTPNLSNPSRGLLMMLELSRTQETEALMWPVLGIPGGPGTTSELDLPIRSKACCHSHSFIVDWDQHPIRSVSFSRSERDALLVKTIPCACFLEPSVLDHRSDVAANDGRVILWTAYTNGQGSIAVAPSSDTVTNLPPVVF